MAERQNKMKLRIRGNSIRLRLLRSEIEHFRTVGRVVDETNFGNGLLTYSLEMSPDVASISAKFENGEIRVVMPEKMAREWAVNEIVGFEVDQDVAENELLTILVEKDFACLDRPDDPDHADAFPHPNLTCEKAE